MEGHMILSGHYQMSLAPLGGWTPMGGHMILSGHYQMFRVTWGGLGPMVGHMILSGHYQMTCGQSISFVLVIIKCLWAMPNVPWSLSIVPISRGHLINTGDIS